MPIRRAIRYSHAFCRGEHINKSELINTVADGANMTKADAASAIDAVFEAITAAMKAGDDVRLVGFGTFSIGQECQCVLLSLIALLN
jgi:hypothetical protein